MRGWDEGIVCAGLLFAFLVFLFGGIFWCDDRERQREHDLAIKCIEHGKEYRGGVCAK